MKITGKSALLRSIGSELNLKFIDVRMGTEDPVVLNGALSIDGDRSTFLPPKRFPLATDPLPLLPEFEDMQADYDGLLVMKDEASIKAFQKKHCYRGWLISFDELPDAPRACQSAAYKILLEREVGQNKLHPRAFTVAAGNRVSDNAAATGEMSSALKSRLVHFTIKSNTEKFLMKLAEWKWDLRIYAYLSYKPSELNTFESFNNSNSSDPTYRCERTWDMVNSYLRANHPDQDQPIPIEAMGVLYGMIGSMASEFVNFTQQYKELITLDQILADPAGCHVPDDRGARYLLITSLAMKVNEDNALSISEYVKRLGTAFAYPFAEMSFIQNDDFMELDGMDFFVNKIVEVKNKFK